MFTFHSVIVGTSWWKAQVVSKLSSVYYIVYQRKWGIFAVQFFIISNCLAFACAAVMWIVVNVKMQKFQIFCIRFFSMFSVLYIQTLDVHKSSKNISFSPKKPQNKHRFPMENSLNSCWMVRLVKLKLTRMSPSSSLVCALNFHRTTWMLFTHIVGSHWATALNLQEQLQIKRKYFRGILKQNAIPA